MFAPVEGVRASRPSTSGLLRSAQVINDGSRWQDGFAWQSEVCPQARYFELCETGFSSPVGSGENGLWFHKPQAFRVEDTCSTRGLVDAGRVRRQADAVTSFMVAAELHSGARSKANPYETYESAGLVDGVNHYLAEPTGTLIAGEYDPVAAIGILEERAREASLGMDPFIHVPISVVPLLDPALRRDGNLLFTKTGATVVADAGYPATGPIDPADAETQTVTITGTPTGGTFTLTYSGQTTAAIAYNAAASAVQTALNNLSNLDGVTVTGSAGGPYSVVFPATSGNVAQMTASGAGLTGGTAPAVNVTTATPGVDAAPRPGMWLYATGPVQVRLSEIVTEEYTNHTRNEITHYASRVFAATFDPCTLHAIEITPPEAA